MRTFLADYPVQLGRIREAVEAGDPPALRRAAHALKGAVSNFAAASATRAALRLQEMGDRGELARAAAGLARLERELGAVAAELTRLAGRGAEKARAPRRPSAPARRR